MKRSSSTRQGRRASRLLAAALSCASVAGAARPALAQVSVETLRKDPLQPGLSGSLDSSLSLSRGNVEQLDIGVGGRLMYQTLTKGPAPYDFLPWDGKAPFLKLRALLIANAHYATQAGKVFTNQAFLHARFTYMLHPRLGPEVFAQYQENEFQRLQARMLGGAGLRAELVQTRPLMMALGTAYMIEYERIQVEAGAPDEPETLSHRWTSFLTARAAVNKDVAVVQNTLYVQPRIDDFEDVRVLDELEIQVKVSEVLSFGTTLSELVDTRPPTGVRTTDLRLSSELHLSF